MKKVKKFIATAPELESNLWDIYKGTAYRSPFEFDVFSQDADIYFDEFQEKYNEVNNLIIEKELTAYKDLFEITNFALNGIDYKNPPNDEVIKALETEAELLTGHNLNDLYDNCFRIKEFLEQQKIEFRKSFKNANDKPRYKSLKDFEENYLIDFEKSEEKSLLIFLNNLKEEYEVNWVHPPFLDELLDLQSDIETDCEDGFIDVLYEFINSNHDKGLDWFKKYLNQKKVVPTGIDLLRYIELELKYARIIKSGAGYQTSAVHETLIEKIKEQKYLISIGINKSSNSINNKRKPKAAKKEIKFSDIFIDPTLADPCLNALKEVNPKLLSDNNTYIGKNKGGWFSLFINTLNKQALIKKLSDTEYAEALNNKLGGLNLSGDEFRKNYVSIKESAEIDLALALSKFSHFSHGGKNGK